MFSHDSDSMPRVWTGKEDIRAITKTARSAVCNNYISSHCILCLNYILILLIMLLFVLYLQSLKLLSCLAAIRLDDDDADNIENTLSLALVDSTSGSVKDRSITTVDPLASSTWENVSFCCYDFLHLKSCSAC